jgi:tripartite-type tricarboxylate transporter receptor subunit TctC
VASTPDALDRHVRAEKEKWGKLIRDVGIKADQ